AERIELLGIAEIEPRLLANPGPQANLERAVLHRRERPKWKPISGASHVGLAPDDENDRLIVCDRYDRSIETDLDTRRLRAGCPFRFALGLDVLALQLRGRGHACAPMFGAPQCRLWYGLIVALF